MITFKQYLNEIEQEPDVDHDSWEDAAVEYMKHCSQFPDINHPLYRISGSAWDSKTHYLRTRSPRTREYVSRGGTAAEQEYILSQPAWAEFPPRRQSIFCSTKTSFDVGSVEDDKSNLLMIFPFDGVKIAMLDDKDFNTMNILKGTSWGDDETHTMSGLSYLIRDSFAKFDEYDSSDEPAANIKKMKALFLKGENEFDPNANGNEEASKNYFELEPDQRRTIKLLVTQFPQKVRPQDIGAKLITSKDLDLPGKTRECWFSGKYLSVPARDYPDFKAEVIKLQKRAAR